MTLVLRSESIRLESPQQQLSVARDDGLLLAELPLRREVKGERLVKLGPLQRLQARLERRVVLLQLLQLGLEARRVVGVFVGSDLGSERFALLAAGNELVLEVADVLEGLATLAEAFCVLLGDLSRLVDEESEAVREVDEVGALVVLAPEEEVLGVPEAELKRLATGLKG